MTAIVPSAVAPPSVTDGQPSESREEAIHDAAQQFEALLINQLVQVMRSTVGEEGLFGSGPGSQMYSHLFDQALSDSMAAAGGMGMREVIERSMLGPAAYAQQAPVAPQTFAPMRPFRPSTSGPVIERRPPSGARLSGAVGQLQATASNMLGSSGIARQWGLRGRLTREDLASQFQTESPRGRAAFNVEDASGFENQYKCNLFAFEMVRRSGFSVPLIGRPRGWGYMGPDGVTADATRGRLRGDWGRIVTGESAQSLDSGIVRGERAFMLTGNSVGDRRGHMGVVERIHEINYDADGEIERIVYDGWEGRRHGATHLERRVWTRQGTPREPGSRSGFEHIAIIELQRPDRGEREERPLHSHARPSFRDVGVFP